MAEPVVEHRETPRTRRQRPFFTRQEIERVLEELAWRPRLEPITEVEQRREELRNPLRMIVSCAALLQRDIYPLTFESRQAMLEQIRIAAARHALMLDDVLGA